MQSLQLKRQLLLLACLFICSVWVLYQIDLNQAQRFILPKPFFVPSENETFWFLINTPGCRIPWLDPLDERIKQFIYPEKPIVCSEKNVTALVRSNLSSLYVDTSQLSSYGVDNISELKCCSKPFRRVVGSEVDRYEEGREVDKEVVWTKGCKLFEKTWRNGKEGLAMQPSHEFVKVSCFMNGTEIYKDYFAFVQDSNENVQQNGIETKRVSVLIIGIDAVSRLNFYRQMPKTVKTITTTLKSVEFFGFNKVEDNTFPNLVPVLTGLSETELKNSCWPSSSSYFDNCPFLWKDFKKAGFTTAFGEDASWMGMFTYMKYGFKQPPTDFYLRIFNHIAENDIGHEKWMNANLCLGTRLNFEVLLDIIAKYGLKMLKKMTFAFFWQSSLSHDYLNLPQQGDDRYVQLIQTLRQGGVFERSVVVFMSDHGIRWGRIRETYQGYLEERLPFLFISYPEWFSEAYSSAVYNLKQNSLKLTTPFDLHETLKDLIDVKKITRDAIKERASELLSLQRPPRGISLFLPVPAARTCKDADISDHWCTCHESYPVDVNNTEVLQSADHLLHYINSLIKAFKQCEQLTVNQILSGRKEITSSTNQSNTLPWIVDYTVMIETIPGLGLFEGTVRHSQKNVDVVGSVSRVNTYGNQSYCMQHYKLKLYCFCKTS